MTEVSLPRSVFVTGATGFLGRHLCRRWVSLGAEVHGFSRKVDGTDNDDLEDVTWHQGDVSDPASLRDALASASPSLLYHLAAYGTTVEQDDRDACFAVNVCGTMNLWRAISDSADNECRVIAAGSCGEYGELASAAHEDTLCQPTGWYAATKHAGVSLLAALGRESGREVVIVRPFGPYGPGDRSNRIVPFVVRELVHGREVEVTAGEQLRDYTFIEDQIEGLVLAASSPLPETVRVYNIGSGRSIRLKELVSAIARTISEEAVARVRFGARAYREKDASVMVANIDRAQRELGYEPRTPLAEGLRRTVEWHRTVETESV